jgi:hypothetical protein
MRFWVRAFLKLYVVRTIWRSVANSVFEGFNLHILQTGIANFTGVF